MARDLIRLPVGPAAPRVPARMTVPGVCHLVGAGVLAGTEAWNERHGGPWLLVAQDEITVDTPAEFFLRELLALDATDDHGLVGWCSRWGIPRLPPTLLEEEIQVVMRRDVTSILAPSGTATETADASTPGPNPTDDLATSGGHNPFLTRLRAAVGDSGAATTYLYDDALYFGPGDAHWVGIPLAVARVAVQVLQCLVRWWTWVVPEEITTEWMGDPKPDLEYFLAWQPFGCPSFQWEGLDAGLTVLNSLLAEAHPLRVSAVLAPNGEHLGHDETPTVADVVALELTRYIDEHIPARQCANETCNRLYVRQTGRARHGQNRITATKYCSDTCAHAQAQRALRRRRAAGKRRDV